MTRAILFAFCKLVRYPISTIGNASKSMVFDAKTTVFEPLPIFFTAPLIVVCLGPTFRHLPQMDIAPELIDATSPPVDCVARQIVGAPDPRGNAPEKNASVTKKTVAESPAMVNHAEQMG